MTRPARALAVLLLLAGLAATVELASWVAWRVTEGSFFSYSRAFTLRAETAATAPAPAEPEEPEETAGADGPGGGDAAAAAGARDGAGLEWLAGHLAGQVVHPFVGFVYSPEYNLLEQRNLENLLVADNGFFVLREEPPPPSERPLRVGVFGGSVAMVFSFQGRRVLEPALAPLAGPRGVVLESYAHGGFKQPQQLMTLAWLLVRGEAPEVVINLDGFNEVTLPRVENLEAGVDPFYPRAWEHRVSGASDPAFSRLLGEAVHLERRRAELAVRFSRPVLRRSVTWNLLWRWLDRRAGAVAFEAQNRLAAHGSRSRRYVAHGPAYEAAGPDQVIADLVAMWEHSSLAMHDLAAGAGLRYYHFLQPNQYVPGSKPLTPEERRLAYNSDQIYRRPAEEGYPALRAAGARLAAQGVAFHDLTDLFAEERRTVYLDDCCHLNPLGNDLVAEAMAEAILADLGTGEPASPVDGPPRSAGSVAAGLRAP